MCEREAEDDVNVTVLIAMPGAQGGPDAPALPHVELGVVSAVLPCLPTHDTPEGAAQG